MRRRLNVKLLIPLALAMAIGGGAIHLVHGYQEARTADFLKVHSERAGQRGDLKEAASYLTRYLALRPDSDEAFADYSLLLDRQAVTAAERFRTLQVLERALGRAPERNDLRRRIIDLAMTPEIHRFRTARDQLLVLLKATPDDGELEGQLGRCLDAFASGEDTDTKQGVDRKQLAAEAARFYESSIQHAPGRIDSYVRLAALLRGPLQDDRRADQLMAAHGTEAGKANLITANPNSAAASLARAQYRRQYQIEGARDDLARAVSLEPTNADVLLAAATLANQEGKGDEARRHLAQAIESHPTDQRIYLTLAAIETQASRYAEAVTCLRDGLRRLPGNGLIKWSLADDLIRANEPAEASALIDQLRQGREILEPALDYLAARVLLAQGEVAAGIDLLDRTRALMTGVINNAEIIRQTDLLLAEGYERLGNPDRQINACRRVLQVDPQSATARLSLAGGLLAQGRVAEAITAYREAIPFAGSARLILARLLTVQNLRLPTENRNWGEVTALLDAIGQSTPDDSEANLLRAQVLATQGNERQAHDLLTRNRDRHPDQMGAWFALAIESQIHGKPADGLAILDEAQRQIGDNVDLRLGRIQFLSRLGDESRADLTALSRDLDRFSAEDRTRLEESLALVFTQLGDDKTAASLWTKVLDARPNDLRVATMLAELALRSEPSGGRAATIKQAIARLRRIEGSEGTSWRRAETLRLLELVRQGDRGRIEEARAMVKEIQSRRQNWSFTSLLEADLDELSGNLDQALTAYQKAIEQGETRPTVVRRTVELLTRRHRIPEADRLIQRMIDQSPRSGQLSRLAAEMSLRREDRDEALNFARQAVQADSVDPAEHLWLGQVLQTSVQTEPAETEFRRAIALDPRRSEPHVALVRLLASQKRTADAEAALTEAKKRLLPEAASTALGLCLEAIGRLDQAKEQFQAAVTREPNNSGLRLTYASFLLRSGQPREAEDPLRVVLDPTSTANESQRATARRDLALTIDSGNQGRFAEALALIELNLNDDRIRSTEDQRIKALLLQGKPAYHREAIRAFEDLERSGPLGTAEKFLLARLYASGDDWFKSRDLLQGLLVTEPKNLDFLATLAAILLDHNRVAEAAGPVDQLVEVAPKALATIDLQARLLWRQGQVDSAVALLENYARTSTGDITPVASALETIGQPKAAEAIYRRLATDGAKPSATLNLALYLGRQGRSDEALNLCEPLWSKKTAAQLSSICLRILNASQSNEAQRQRVTIWLQDKLKADPNNPSLLFDLANLEDMNGHYDQAEVLLRRSIASAPRFSGPLNNLAWMLTVHGERQAEALDLINQAIAIDGPDPDLLDTRSLIYLAHDQADRAIKDLELVAASKPSALTFFHLAQAQNEAGNRQKALEMLHKAQAEGLSEQIVHPFERPRLQRLVAELARNAAP